MQSNGPLHQVSKCKGISSVCEQVRGELCECESKQSDMMQSTILQRGEGSSELRYYL
jgi:hypothetical protein